MAKIVMVDKRHPRRKKFEHFKLKTRVWLLRASVLLNAMSMIYFAYEQGYLTNIIKHVTPIMESIKLHLPL